MTTNFIIKQATTRKDLDSVYRVTHDSIVMAGYCEPTMDGRIITHPQLDVIDETYIIMAVSENKVIGTSSVTIDSIHGLHADTYFKEECKQVRNEGRKLGAAWRIATSPYYKDGNSLVMSLIQETINIGVYLELNTVLLTFNPKHENLYKRLLNAETIAYQQKMNHSIINAGAVLMRLDLKNCPDRWLTKEQKEKIMQNELKIYQEVEI